MTSIMNPALGAGGRRGGGRPMGGGFQMGGQMGGPMDGGRRDYTRPIHESGRPMGGPMGGGLPPGIDPQAVAANPEGFQRWMQGYQQRQASPQGGPPGGAPGFEPAGGGMAVNMANSMAGDTPPAGTSPAGVGLGGPWQMTSISPGNSLIGQQIMPGDSATTQMYGGWAQQAGQQYNQQNFAPFQGMGALNYGSERGMLTGAQNAMQGLNYDFTGANQRFTDAQRGLSGAADRADLAARTSAGQLGDLLGAAGQGYGVSSGGLARADTGRFNQELDAAGEGLKGPDRTKLAADALGLMEERSQPGFERGLRDVMAKNAAMGRRGSGITTNELGDVTLARERELSQARRELSNQAAGQTLADRLAVSQQQQGIAQTRFGGEQFNAQLADNAANRSMQASMAAASNRLRGLDLQRGIIGDQYQMGQDAYGRARDASGLSMDIGDRLTGQQRDAVNLGRDRAGFTRNIANDMAGMTRDTYNAGRDERDAARRDQYDQAAFTRQRFQDMRGAQNDERQYDYNRRQEARGERNWQYGLSRDAIDDDYRRQGWEENIRNNRYNRALGYTGIGFGGNNVAGAYQNQAGAYGNRANDWFSVAGEAAQWMGQQRRGGQQSPQTRP